MVNLKKKFNKHPLQLRLRAKLYNTTEIGLLELYAVQNGKCACCDKLITFEGRKPNTAHVDHDHKTGVVRGLLCAHCNKGLGLFKDDPVALEKAAKYIKRTV